MFPPALIRSCLGLVVPAALLLLPEATQAQEAGATLRGSVVDSELGEPLAGAVIRIRPGTVLLSADSQGRFEATSLPPGDVEVAIEALGYQTRTWKVTLAGGKVVERSFSLDFTGERLPEVVVTARATKLMPRYIEFERRRERGLGAYLRWDEIKERNLNTVGEAARTFRGVRLVCDQAAFECFIRMARTMNCPPIWFVDGVQVASFHENTSIRDVYGLEVYRGPGEIPAEFGGSASGCGVIVIWTKSKPFR